MAVNVEIIQSGSGSTIIHAQPGDTLTFRINNHAVWGNILDHFVNQLNSGLSGVAGVTFTPDPTTEAS